MSDVDGLLDKAEKWLAVRDAEIAIMNDANFSDQLIRDLVSHIKSDESKLLERKLSSARRVIDNANCRFKLIQELMLNLAESGPLCEGRRETDSWEQEFNRAFKIDPPADNKEQS